jgi:hypothetical protein
MYSAVLTDTLLYHVVSKETIFFTLKHDGIGKSLIGNGKAKRARCQLRKS